MSFKTTVNVIEKCDNFSVNCRICGGEIIPALSPKEYKRGNMPQNISFAAYSNGTKTFYVCGGNDLFTSANGESYYKTFTFAGGTPVFLEHSYENYPCAVILKGKQAIRSANSEHMLIPAYGTELSCGVMHCGRLFGADASDGYKIRWSGGDGWRDWNKGLKGSGCVEMGAHRGKVLDILEYGEKLVAVREFGLTLFDMFGDPENFAVDLTDTDSEKIYKGTARVAGGKIVFFTDGGLTAFDGSHISTLPCAYNGDISLPTCSAVLGTKYFLSCKSKKLGGGAVLCYDVSGGENYLINFSADGLCSADKIYALNSQGSYTLEEGGEYSLTCGNLNFGSGGHKTVTSMFIDGDGVNVEISNGRVSRKFENAKGIIRPALRGRVFSVKITGTKPVRAVFATAEECNAI